MEISTQRSNDFDANSQTFNSAKSYWLTRFVILRLLGLVYTIAFLVAINQLIPLIGAHGLLPLKIYLNQVSSTLGSDFSGFLRLPSLFWFWNSDAALITVSWIGFAISCLVVAGFANIPMLAILWFLYMSIVHAGQEWYSYGWEIQLTETGFLAIFLCPFLDMRPFPKYKTPLPIIILFRWLIFRIMIGAGLIKIRGDQEWVKGIVLQYFFETQPMPGPLTRWFHFLPSEILRVGVWFNWVAELIAPIFVFWPRYARLIAGIIIITFQLFIIASGNLSFLNWLTIIPALACFDDGFWSKILPAFLVKKAKEADRDAIESKPLLATTYIVAALVGVLSIQPVLNIISPGQIMNTSFDPLDLVNTYGAFGTVGKERFNVVFEGTTDSIPDEYAHWQPYFYKGLPVLLDRKPPQIAPYQLRLDWQMWFASMSSPNEYPWTLNLIWKLLQNDARIISLFEENPFPKRPPKYIRAVLYKYEFENPDKHGTRIWKRQQLDIWLPPISLDDKRILEFLKSAEWVE